MGRKNVGQKMGWPDLIKNRLKIVKTENSLKKWTWPIGSRAEPGIEDRGHI